MEQGNFANEARFMKAYAQLLARPFSESVKLANQKTKTKN